MYRESSNPVDRQPIAKFLGSAGLVLSSPCNTVTCESIVLYKNTQGNLTQPFSFSFRFLFACTTTVTITTSCIHIHLQMQALLPCSHCNRHTQHSWFSTELHMQHTRIGCICRWRTLALDTGPDCTSPSTVPALRHHIAM